MHKRPSLVEAIQVLKQLAPLNDECKCALDDYYILKAQGDEFFAALMVVDIVDHYYHILSTKGLAHG